MKTAKLILGGGSAYGLAHIGVVKAVKEHFQISGIIGTSMGAIIGACSACSLSAEKMLELALDVSTVELFSPLGLDLSMSGIFDGKTAHKLFSEWTKDGLIECAKIPYIAVAYDLEKQCPILITTGSFADAMRASSSLPYIFAPYQVGRYLFVDGGVTHPLPLAFAPKVPGDITIAVNVLPSISMNAEIMHKESSFKRKRILRHEVLIHSMMQNQAFIAIQAMLQYQPDIYIEASHPKLKFTDLKKAEEFAQYGYNVAKASISAHKEPGFKETLHDAYKQLINRLSILKAD